MANELAALAAALYGLEEGLGPYALEDLAAALPAEIERQFSAGSDPYGAAWAPLARGGQSHLIETGTMLASLVVTSTGKEIQMSMDSPAPYHQSGTSRMPARPIFPDEGQIPPSWEAIIQAAVDNQIRAKVT